MNTQTYIQNSEYEANSCSVIAVSKCMDILYTEAYRRMHHIGRVQGSGIYNFGEYAVKLGLRHREDLAGNTLRQTLPKLASGRYILRVTGHLFCVIDGTVYDTWKQTTNKKVLMVYEYTTQ